MNYDSDPMCDKRTSIFDYKIEVGIADSSSPATVLSSLKLVIGEAPSASFFLSFFPLPALG